MKEYVFLTMLDYSEWKLPTSVIIDNYIKNLIEYDDMSDHLIKISEPKKPNYENDWNCSDVIVT